MLKILNLIVIMGASCLFAAGQTNAPFLLAVEDAFSISGRGTIATGQIMRGTVKVGDAVEIVGPNGATPTTVTAIEMFRKTLTEAKAGDDVGLVLRGVDKTVVSRGQVIAKPGTVKAYKKFKAKIDMIPTAEGGRSRPAVTGYRPLVAIFTGSYSGTLSWSSGRAEIAPGDKGVEVEVGLTEPAPMEKGTEIRLKEGGRTIAKGVVTAMVEVK